MDAELEVRQLEVRLLRLLAASRRCDAFTDAREAALGQAASDSGAAHEAALARLAAVQTAGEAAQQRLAALQQVRISTLTYLMQALSAGPSPVVPQCGPPPWLQGSCQVLCAAQGGMPVCAGGR